jgi:phenylacetate-CoA ligase
VSVTGVRSRASLEADQLAKLRRLLGELQPGNRFYAPRLRDAGLGAELREVSEFTSRMPFTTKDELVADQERHPPYGTNLTYPLDRYVRFHQTSGTTGKPLRWLDTAESWSWMVDSWVRVFRAAGAGPEDRIFFPFSFGPFLGFWAAFDAAPRLGALALPGGGMSSKGRLRVLLDNAATALCCTPTYAIRLAEVAAEEGVDLGRSSVRRIFVAGEPGGSVPAIRQRLTDLWGGAGVWDHHGMTEVGPVSYPNPERPGILHVMESSYLAEVLDPESGEPVGPGGLGELILTTLGRLGSPLLRYRTGDLVRISEHTPEELGTPDLALDGGILARADDMVVVRGVNLYPSAVEQVVRRVDGIAEYRVELGRSGSMAELRVRVEPAPEVRDPEALARELEDAFRTAFQLRVPVLVADRGALPRFELKAKRWVRSP